MSTWPSPRTRLLKNMCLRTNSQSRRNLLLIRKRSRDYNNLLLRLYKRCKQKTHKKKNQKEKTQCTTSWGGLLEVEVSIEPIISKSLSANPINKVMSME
jgi:hypothetical protein